jgi:hypothetical protein
MKLCDVCNKCWVDYNTVCVECWWENSGVNKDNEYCHVNKMTFAKAKENYKSIGIISASLSKLKANHFQKNVEAFQDCILKEELN